MPKIKKVATLSLAVLLAQVLLIKTIYTWLGTQTQTVFSINPASISGTQIGDTILSYLTGFTNFALTDFTVWVSMFIGAFILVYAGFFIYEQKYVKMWKGRNLSQRIFAILSYGTIVLYGLLYLMKMNVPGIALNLLIGLAINLIAITALVTFSASKLNFPRI